MKQSLPGLLLRAASACERSPHDEHLAFPLRQLLKHLREVRADPALLGEFLALYVDDGDDHDDDRDSRD